MLVSLGLTTHPTHAYETATHEIFNEEAAKVVQQIDDSALNQGQQGPVIFDKYTEIYKPEHINEMREGGVQEDDFDWTTVPFTNGQWHVTPVRCRISRFVKHFYHPGLESVRSSSNKIGLKTITNRCIDAVQWARNSTKDLTWTGAIESYGYKQTPKLHAYRRVGHVAHLIGDMVQPDHIHLNPHALQTFEPYAEENPPYFRYATENIFGNYGSDKLTALALQIPNSGKFELEDYLMEPAKITYAASTFKGPLSLVDAETDGNEILTSNSQFTQMFTVQLNQSVGVGVMGVPVPIVYWSLFNKTAGNPPPISQSLGTWDLRKGVIESSLPKHPDDAWWETRAEFQADEAKEIPPQTALYGVGYYTLGVIFLRKLSHLLSSSIQRTIMEAPTLKISPIYI